MRWLKAQTQKLDCLGLSPGSPICQITCASPYLTYKMGIKTASTQGSEDYMK